MLYISGRDHARKLKFNIYVHVPSNSTNGRFLVQETLLFQRQILGTGKIPQDSAPVCINIDISPEMAAQSAQRNQAFCVTASDWSPITSA